MSLSNCLTTTFQSTLPLRGATCVAEGKSGNSRISIHAPLAGSDRIKGEKPVRNAVFQSTLPLRGATTADFSILESVKHFNPRSPCGERRAAVRSRVPARQHFNPRSPCGERPRRERRAGEQSRFQSTLPLRGATRTASSMAVRTRDFNPRSPCGERPPPRPLRWASSDFNPRSPCGERRCPTRRSAASLRISIHAPLAGSDCCEFFLVLGSPGFQSTLPLRGATRT